MMILNAKQQEEMPRDQSRSRVKDGQNDYQTLLIAFEQQKKSLNKS